MPAPLLLPHNLQQQQMPAAAPANWSAEPFALKLPPPLLLLLVSGGRAKRQLFTAQGVWLHHMTAWHCRCHCRCQRRCRRQSSLPLLQTDSCMAVDTTQQRSPVSLQLFAGCQTTPHELGVTRQSTIVAAAAVAQLLPAIPTRREPAKLALPVASTLCCMK